MSRTVFCEDAFDFLEETFTRNNRFDAVVTSLPDSNDLGMTMDKWIPWFQNGVLSCLRATKDTGVCIFYQTDRKADAQWYSKPYLIQSVVRANTKMRTLWHKIVLRQEPGKTNLYRPSYSHVLAFSVKGKVGKAFPDVLTGDAWAWANGMPIGPTLQIVKYARTFGPTLLDPFCGHGTVLSAAERADFEEIVGVELDPDRAAISRTFDINTAINPGALFTE